MMRYLWLVLLVLLPLSAHADTVTWVNEGANGVWDNGETVQDDDMNAIATAIAGNDDDITGLDSNRDDIADVAASVSADAIDADSMADADFGDWTCATSVCTLDADVVSTAEMADADFGDWTCVSGSCTLDSGTVDATAIATGALTAADAAADLATQAELDAKSAATSTDNAVPKFDSTAGDVQNSGVLIDDSNNLTVPGSITSGGTEVPTCIIMRDSDDGGDSACSVLNGTFSCETDTNGVCDDAT